MIEFQKKLKSIKLLIMDVDGVFTDGAFYMNGSGSEYKKFSAKDGLGIGLLKAINLPMAIISGKHSDATTYRMNELGINEDVYQGKLKKIDSYNLIKDKYKVNNDEVVFIGDDLIDIPTETAGGEGAVREVIDLILQAQNKYTEAMEKLLDYKTEE
jgi:3-deoxy-D-manno-octulosonate 8-phosphate phosphatase (KDO 8-P phosphatase)